MKTYRLTRGGVTFEVQLTEADAKRYGAQPIEEAQPKAVAPRNKARTAKNRGVPNTAAK